MKNLLVFIVLAFAPAVALAAQELFFVGSGRANIEAYRLDVATGAVTPLGTAAEISAPSYLAIAPNHRLLYAVSEGRSAATSTVSGFAIGEDGKLERINSQATKGAGPCYVEVDQSGKNVLVANYNSGSAAVFPIDSKGSLQSASAFLQDSGSSVNPARQKGPHAHCIVTDPNDRFACVCDLGTDKLMIFQFDPAAGSLTAANPPFASVAPGAGPRHIAFAPSGKWAYVTDEMASTVTAFSWDSLHGVLGYLEVYPLLSADYSGVNTAAEVEMDRAGKYVYCSNRGENTIVQFRCDPKTGRLTFVARISCGGRTPRQFMIDPSGRFLLAANQDSNNVAVFRIDKKTGKLKAAGIQFPGNEPECVQFQ